ncbi:MAG: hypothetical protein J0M17_05060 [Planctomycetes bacterium]|nr:hypothetical protein [Planctomycetota bacterium]
MKVPYTSSAVIPTRTSILQKHLTQRTTLDDLAKSWNVASFRGEAANAWRKLRSEVQQALLDGGELWEWETEGLRSFAGVYGIAVVRDGVWVW